MPFFQAFLFLLSVAIIVAATQSRRLHPFLAIVIVASAFGFAVGFSIGPLGKAFGAGFSEAVYSPGLVIIAAGFIAALAESSGTCNRLTAKVDYWRERVGSTAISAVVGLIAGIGASPATAFAVLKPLLPAIRGGRGQRPDAAPIALALAISASHGLALFSPVPIAATAILGAKWERVALFGLPLALLLAAVGAAWSRWLPSPQTGAQPQTDPHDPGLEQEANGSAAILLLAVAIPLLLLIVQSLGDIPSEPLGGGPARELVLGIGRPLILFLAGLGIMSLGCRRTGTRLLADFSWTGRVLANVAGIVMIVGAAGGLQRLCQETGMAELLGERLLGWHVGTPFGLLVPFVIAALIKSLQGSSLVAAITTAGMVQPLLAQLGIAGDDGKALAALAIGAGAMAISHINDGFFWLVADSAGATPIRAFAAFAAGTLVQGLIAAGFIVVFGSMVAV